MKNSKKIKVNDILTKYNLLDKKLSALAGNHLNILKKDFDEFIAFLKKENIIDISNCKTEKDFAEKIFEIIEKCDSTNSKYDDDIYMKIAKYGNHYIINGGHNHNIWANGMFEDDGFGLGKTNTDLYDDYIDSENNKKL